MYRILNSVNVIGLVEWCDQVKIFDVFFTKTLHPELIKKSFYLLEFLHKNQRLGEGELLHMWNVATKKHEAYRHAIFEALSYLARKCLTLSQIRFLFVKIKGMSFKDHDKGSLILLKSLAQRLAPKTQVFQNNIDEFKVFDSNKNRFDYGGRRLRTRSMSETQLQVDLQQIKRQRSFSPKDVYRHRDQITQFLLLDNQNEQQRPLIQFQDPFEVSKEKQDKNTADEELSPKTGNIFGSGIDQSFQNQVIQQNQNVQPIITLEESKQASIEQLPFRLVPLNLYTEFQPSGSSLDGGNDLAKEILTLMWGLCLDDAILGTQQPQLIGQQKGNLAPIYHQLCLDQFSEVICQNFTECWFYFMYRIVENIKANRYTITMQLLIRKFLGGLQFPLKEGLPKDRNELLRAIESQLKLTHVCICSYVDFKRECLELINAQNFGQQEDDNLETQSSLDDEESNTLEENQIEVQSQSQRVNRVVNSEGEIKEERKEYLGRVGSVQRTQVGQNIGTRSFLDSLITNKVYQYSFHKEINERMNFLKTIIIQCPEHLLKQNQLQLLWEVLVQNAFYEKERDLFFNWCTEILKAAQIRQNQFLLKSGYNLDDEAECVFSDDCLELLYFETFLKLDFRTFTLSMLNCFWEFFLHVNSLYGQIEMLALQEFKVYTHRLIGIETLWQIVLTSIDEQVHKQSSILLTKLFKRIEMTTEIKQYILQLCITHIKKALADENPDTQLIQIARFVRVICNFIMEFEFNKHEKPQIKNPDIKFVVNNSISGSQGPTKLEFNLPSNTTIGAVLAQCASSVFPRRTVEQINLMYKGKDLKEPLKTIKEVCTSTPIIMILTSKSEIELEYEEMQGFASTVDNLQHLKESIQNLKEFLGETSVSDKVIGLALKKCNFDLGEAIDMVTSESQIENLEAQLISEEATQPEISLIVSDQNEEFSLNQMLSNDSEYFDLLFDLLNFGHAELTESVWNLLIQIPVNKALFMSIKSLDTIKLKSESEFIGWEQILDPSQTYKMLYSLQLLNQLVFTNSEQLQDSERNERVSWRLKFLEFGGFNHLYYSFLTSEIDKGDPPAAVQTKSRRRAASQKQIDLRAQKNDQARCQALLVSLIQIFVSAALLGIDDNLNLHQIIYNSSTSPFKKNQQQQVKKSDFLVEDIQQFEQSQDRSSTDKSSQNTPKFNQSFCPSFETSPVAPPQNSDSQNTITTIAKGQTRTQVDDFPKLISQMKEENISSKILFEVMNIPEFFRKLLYITQHTLNFQSGQNQNGAQSQNFQSELIQRCLDTMLPLIIWQKELLIEINEDQCLENILVKGLSNSCEQVRQSIERFFRIGSQNLQNISNLVMQCLYRLLPQSQDFEPEYFSLLAFVNILNPQSLQMLQNQESNQSDSLLILHNGKFQIEAILDLLVQMMLNNSNNNDSQLAGISRVIVSLLEIQPLLKHKCREKYDLINVIYDMMFKIEPTIQPEKLPLIQEKKRFYSKLTRKKFMELLKNLCAACFENFVQLLSKMQNFSNQINEVLNSRDLSEYLANQGQQRSEVGYVGLKNFGSTCYMNSLIQQLYMIKDFREILINFEQPVSNQVVTELRKIFANLQESQKKSYAPTGFTQAFQFIRGEPVNVRQQQDTHEFFSVLLDNIENSHPNLQSILKEIFGGSVVNETKSLETDYPYQSFREEPFYCLSLDIKNKKSLKEALDFYVKPEVLEGENKYFCEKYKTHIDVSRRNSLKKLSDTFVIHLKRFEFDLNQMQDYKINEILEFPEEIDFRPWTNRNLHKSKSTDNLSNNDFEQSEKSQGIGRFSDNEAISEELLQVNNSNGLGSEVDQELEIEVSDQQLKSTSGFEDLIGSNNGELNSSPLKHEAKLDDSDQFLYELVGVLVHSGGVNSGHYYSYIKERDGSARWLEFNDTNVKEFDIENLADKCYGSKIQKEKAQEQWQQFQFESSNNAYLLFYQRIKKQNIVSKINFQTAIKSTQVSELVNVQKPIQKADLLSEIWNENDAFIKMSHFLDPDYFQFVFEFVKLGKVLFKNSELLKQDEALNCLQFGCKFAFDMIQKVKDTRQFIQWMPLLCQMFEDNLQASKWLLKFLITNSNLIIDILLEHSNAERWGEAKEQFATLIKTAIRVELFNERETQQSGLISVLNVKLESETLIESLLLLLVKSKVNPHGIQEKGLNAPTSLYQNDQNHVDLSPLIRDKLINGCFIISVLIKLLGVSSLQSSLIEESIESLYKLAIHLCSGDSQSIDKIFDQIRVHITSMKQNQDSSVYFIEKLLERIDSNLKDQSIDQ